MEPSHYEEVPGTLLNNVGKSTFTGGVE